MSINKAVKSTDRTRSQAFGQLRGMLDRPASSLDWHYKAGKLMLRLLPERAQREQYGKGRIIELRNQLGLPEHREKYLYALREFSTQYKQEDLPALEGLSWSHVHFLLGVKDLRRRRQLVRQCRKHKLGCHALRQLIYEQRPHRPTGGRHPDNPQPLGPKAALKEVVRLSNQWVEYCGFWLDEITPALKRAARQRKPEPQLAELIGQAESALAKLHREVCKRRHELRSLNLKSR